MGVSIMGNNVEKLSGEQSGRVVQQRAEITLMTSPKLGEIEAAIAAATVTQWGKTVSDARRFTAKAKIFYLAVRTGVEDYTYVPVSRAAMKRILARYYAHESMPCEFVHKAGGELWIGTAGAIRRAAESDQ